MLRKILVVDDENSVVKRIEEKLEAKGYVVSSAYTGFGAIQTAIRDIPDLMILDFMMPDMSAPEIITELRKNETTKTLPVILLISRSPSLDDEELMKNYEDEYVISKIIKPFNVYQIVEAIYNYNHR